MTNLTREILRMVKKGVSQRRVVSALSCSRHQVAKKLQKAVELKLAWPLPDDITDDMAE